MINCGNYLLLHLAQKINHNAVIGFNSLFPLAVLLEVHKMVIVAAMDPVADSNLLTACRLVWVIFKTPVLGKRLR